MSIDELIETLTDADYDLAGELLSKCNGRLEEPDLTISPKGEPYLYRWYLLPFTKTAGNVYLHIQVQSDPERPLHDHPWDNQSVILSGGYDEVMHDWNIREYPGGLGPMHRIQRTAGDTIQRKAEEAHRLILPPGTLYTMTIFSTGPKRRRWGFWYPDGWHDNERHVLNRDDGTSIHV